MDRERAFPEGATVPQRWTDDRQAYTEQLDWIDGGGRRRARDSARRAARLRLRLEGAQARLEAQEAVDDPLVLADYELVGKAVTGTVVAVDMSHREPGPRRQVQRPLITLESVEPSSMPMGKTLWWTADPGRVGGVLRDITPSQAGGSRITIMITSGMRGTLPALGARAGFSVLTPRQGPSLPLPQTLPWTHEPPAATDPTAIDDSARPGWEEAS
jgi:hypothetical protein